MTGAFWGSLQPVYYGSRQKSCTHAHDQARGNIKVNVEDLQQLKQWELLALSVKKYPVHWRTG